MGMIDGPNMYIYVHNNPVNFIDTVGLKKEVSPWEKIKNWLTPEALAYDSPVPFGNDVIEAAIGQKLKEAAPDMPAKSREKAAEALRKEMTEDEYKSLKDKKVPDDEKKDMVNDIIKRATERPENQKLKTEMQPWLDKIK